MSILKNPSEINEDVKLAGLIYGQPGVGKTTLLLSGPTPVLIDADQGLRRVEKRFQVPSLPLASYDDFLALLEGKELDPFESIVIDTLGKFIDRMGDKLMRDNPKYRQSDGSLTLKAYGAVRVEFQRVLRAVKDKNKFLFFGAHEREERDGDNRFVRPDVAGSAGKDLVKDLDFMGYMEMRGNKRTISFSPSEKHYAKNSLQLEEVIEVPDTKNGNSFLKSHIIDRAIERLKADDVQNKEYNKLLASHTSLIDCILGPETADKALQLLNEAPELWDSTRVAKKKLNEKITALGLLYDKVEKKFKMTMPEQPKPEPEVKAAMDAKLGDAPPPKTAPPAAASKQSTLDILADALVNGIAECEGLAQLNAYLKAQQSDIAEVSTKAALGTQLKLGDAISEKRKSFEKKAA